MQISLKRIVVPTDFSEFSLDALAYAHALATQFGAVVTMVHALERPQDVPWWLATQEYHARRGTLEKEAHARLVALAEKHLPGVSVEFEVRAGVPADEICEAAAECHADIIVIGTHGRGGLSRVMFGSVTENVVRHSPCPVLTVRPRAGTEN